jgi:hypothetical protein
VVCADAHLMPQYRRSVGESDWVWLPVLRPTQGTFANAEAWLANAAAGDGASIMLSAGALRLILSALDWILRQLGRGVGLAVPGGATIILPNCSTAACCSRSAWRKRSPT